MPKSETKEVAEIATDEQGNWLWTERYILSRMSAVDELFIRDYKEYRVISSHFTKGHSGGGLVEHVVKLVADRTPEQQEPEKYFVQDGKLTEVMEAKNQELHRRIEQICGGTIHAQLKRIGIAYNIPTAQWRFLNIGQEKSLAALLIKLFVYDVGHPVFSLILRHYTDKGAGDKFVEWLAEHAVVVESFPESEGGPAVMETTIKLNPISAQKELPPPDSPGPPDLREEGSADYPGL